MAEAAHMLKTVKEKAKILNVLWDHKVDLAILKAVRELAQSILRNSGQKDLAILFFAASLRVAGA